MKKWLTPWLLFVLTSGALTAPDADYAHAAEAHRLDQALSLTGNCEIEPVDLVPDPGCPGGSHPPAGRFSTPAGIAVDSYGDIYVASAGSEKSGETGHIDVFSPEGKFITEVVDTNGPGPMVVDSKGNLYVSNRFKETEENIVRYNPITYQPAGGLIAYGSTPQILVKDGGSSVMGLALESFTDRVWVKYGFKADLFSSAAEENKILETFESDFGGEGLGIAVDEANGLLYAANINVTDGVFVEAFELAPPHTPLFAIKGSSVPDGKFDNSGLSLAVDEGSGHLLVFEGLARKIYEFDSTGGYLGTIDVNVDKAFEYVYKSALAVDNGQYSPNGALSTEGRYLYVPSGHLRGHSFAFGPSKEGSPEVESISFENVGEREAELRAAIEPFGLPTHYVFEYISLQNFENGGFAGAQVAGEGEIPGGGAPVSVTAGAVNLEPGTAYRFRVTATNAEGADGEEGQFATYPVSIVSPPCPNEALRIGPSARLSDCRTYELVTPANTNARSPFAAGGSNLGTFFASREVSPEGDRVSFEIEGGSIPGIGDEATGSLAGDPYLATRMAAGWSTAYAGPNGFEAPQILPGSHSPDQGFSFWQSDDAKGSAQVGGEATSYVRYPDGHSALVGRGSIANDPQADGKLISEGGGHIVFTSRNFTEGDHEHPSVQLEPDAPTNGTQAIYDRTADEATHVVSLLPGNRTPTAGENATYEGASLDGRGVAFTIGDTLYLRVDDVETYEVGKEVTFAGVAEGGSRIFYLQGGDLFRYDAKIRTRNPFSTTGDVTPVNVSADGAVAYFVSSSVITKAPNPNGAKAAKGAENLYRSQEGAIDFVGTVTERDVVGEFMNEATGGLGLWTKVVGLGRLANDPSRTTPDGAVFLFESRAPLDGYDAEGHAEIYRYDSTRGELACLSCNPTLAPADADASLQSVSHGLADLSPLGPFSRLGNLSPDGRRAFFQSSEALVPDDTDGLQDVYEWEALGVGSCGRPRGCTSLISSGHSQRTDYLYALSDSGDDVFFRSSDILLSSDLEDTPSIYDARVNGGFGEANTSACRAEGCRPDLSAQPPLPITESGVHSAGSGTRCPKGKRKARRHGKIRCVKRKKKHHRHHRQRKAGKNEKGGRK
jgi:hypothetical protein